MTLSHKGRGVIIVIEIIKIMFKKSLLSLLVISSFALASEKNKHKNLEAEIQNRVQAALAQQQVQQQNLLKQRENFLAADNLLSTASKQKLISTPTLELASKLVATLEGYPLQMDAEASLVKYKFDMGLATAQVDLNAFMQKYPTSFYNKRLAQLPFALLSTQQKWAELFDYSKTVAPESEQNQCRVMNASYQLLAEKAKADTAQNMPVDPNAMNDLFEQFAKLWLKTTVLPAECADLATAWQGNGGQTDALVMQKAINLFEKNAKEPFHQLITSDDNALNRWLSLVETLMNDPKTLDSFIQAHFAPNQATPSQVRTEAQNQTQAQAQPQEVTNAPQNAFQNESRAIVLKAFQKWVKTLTENMDNPSFAPVQAWADKLALNENELREWKIAYLNRLFDNGNSDFQNWRDEQITQLKADNLTERRLRTALAQQTDTAAWLALLSDEGKAKLEWRYWAAKNEPDEAKRKALLTEIAKERGFYPMLAAQLLEQPYQFQTPEYAPLNEEQMRKFSPEFDRLQELRTLERYPQSRLELGIWFQSLSTDEQLAVTDELSKRNWYDLAVGGSIQAKAFDYINLRLPNAYSDWFELNLADKKISKTFAQAIARQESAWNAQAKSHANALGLMQMLPSTAKKTAEDESLPFEGESDLLQPFNNIMLGTAHLAELNAKYPNNRALIAAAYNAGASRVEQWLARADGKLSFDAFVASIPFYETRGYVQNVLAYDYYYQVLQNQTQKVLFTPEEIERKY